MLKIIDYLSNFGKKNKKTKIRRFSLKIGFSSINLKSEVNLTDNGLEPCSATMRQNDELKVFLPFSNKVQLVEESVFCGLKLCSATMSRHRN